MDPLHLDAGLLFWSVFTFACLLLVLARFAFKPLKKVLDAREADLRNSLDEARKARQEAADVLAENERRIEEARRETERMIGEGRKIAADMERQAGRKASEAAEEMMDRARADMQQELQRSLDELKGTVANLSVQIARRVIQAELDEERHLQLADDFIERLKKSRAAKGS